MWQLMLRTATIGLHFASRRWPRRLLVAAAGTLVARARLAGSEIQLTAADRREAAAFEQQSDEEDNAPPGLTVDPDAFDRAICKGVDRGVQGKRRFLRHWVSVLRLEFPARANRPSDRAVMTKWLAARLREHGMRTSHMADMVPRAVALALNPSRAEILAAEEADVARIRSVGGRWLHTALRWLGFRSPPPKPGI